MWDWSASAARCRAPPAAPVTAHSVSLDSELPRAAANRSREAYPPAQLMVASRVQDAAWWSGRSADCPAARLAATKDRVIDRSEPIVRALPARSSAGAA